MKLTIASPKMATFVGFPAEKILELTHKPKKAEFTRFDTSTVHITT